MPGSDLTRVSEEALVFTARSAASAGLSQECVRGDGDGEEQREGERHCAEPEQRVFESAAREPHAAASAGR